MFDTEDWNDGAEAQHLSRSIHRHWQPASGVQEPVQAAPGVEQKLLRKRLLETLRVLEIASQSYQNDEGFLPARDSSGSENNEAESTVTCSKHKKRRSKQGLSMEIPRAGPETPLKKKRPCRKSIKTRSEESRGTAQDGAGKVVAVTVQIRGTRDEGRPVLQLSRKEWKNKQKNKKRNKNKFKMTSESRGIKPLTELGFTKGRAAGSLMNGALCLKSSHSPGSKICGVSKVSQGTNARSRKEAMLTPLEGQLTKARPEKQEKILQQRNTVVVTGVSGTTVGTEVAVTQESTEVEWAEVRTDRSAALRIRMEEQLKAARFRYINQQLYTSSSQEAQRLFLKDPEAFQIYHHGFNAQLQRWPQNPADEIIKYLRNRPASLVVADFGCGDCKIARSVRNTVHSFDLAALNDHVTVCDMSKVPLQDESVDVAVFCLALMGTNLREFLEEANRVLKSGGILKIAEVASRFEDIRAFIGALANLGFKNISKDISNSFFYTFDFTKTGPPRSKGKLPGLQLKACLYKKR